MTTFTGATLVIFASLGIIGLSVGLLARRYSFPALAIGLAGLLALTTASTWITLAWPDTINQLTAKLKQDLTIANSDLQRLRIQIPPLESKVQALKSERYMSRIEHKTAQTQLKDANLAAEREKHQADELDRKFKAERASHTKTASKATAAETRSKDLSQQLTEKEHEFEQLKTERNDERAKHAETKLKLDKLKVAIQTCKREPMLPKEKPAKLDPPVINPQLLRAGLGRRLENDCYISQSLPRRELVAGYKGSWYTLRLKSDGRPLLFADGQFRIPGAKQEIEACARQLHYEVVVPVAKVAKRIRLFVRGGADSRRIIGQVEDPGDRELTFLPRQRNGKYARDTMRQAVTSPLSNKDLPNLRADWLRQLIRPVPAASRVGNKNIGEIDILQNMPGRGHERTANFLLYVEW